MNLRSSTLMLLLWLGTMETGWCFYNPQPGRWISRDPINEAGQKISQGRDAFHHETINVFSFVENDAIQLFDAFGLYSFKGCSKNQEDAFKKAMADNCKKAKDCAKQCGTSKVDEIIKNFCDNKTTEKPVIICVDATFQFSDGKTCKDNLCGRGYEATKEIFLCPGIFDPAQQNKFGCPISCVPFHEALHTGGFSHGEMMTKFDKCMGCLPQPASQ